MTELTYKRTIYQILNVIKLGDWQVVEERNKNDSCTKYYTILYIYCIYNMSVVLY